MILKLSTHLVFSNQTFSELSWDFQPACYSNPHRLFAYFQHTRFYVHHQSISTRSSCRLDAVERRPRVDASLEQDAGLEKVAKLE